MDAPLCQRYLCGMPVRKAFLVLPLLLVLLPTRGGALVLRPLATYTFGLSLSPGPNSQLFSLFLVKEFEGQVIQSEGITREQFVLQAQGAIPSKANLDGVNLFHRHQVGLCLHPDDNTGTRLLRDCEVFDQLWKLRFWEYPFVLKEGQHPGKGWAEKRESPSSRQLLLLTDYGILTLNGMAKGDDVFRLLHDVGDSAWVDNYRKGY
jgi:hypothetical protein